MLLVFLSDDEGDLDEQQEPILVTEIVENLDSNLIMTDNSQQDPTNNDQENIDCDYIQPTIDNQSELRAILAQVSRSRFRLKKNRKKTQRTQRPRVVKTLANNLLKRCFKFK